MTVKHRIEWHPEEIFRQINTVMAEVTEESAEMVAADARRFFKKNYKEHTSKSVESIKVTKSKFTDGGHLVVAGGGEEYYMTFLELGADNLTAKAFLRPALAKNKRKIRKRFRDAMK